MADKEIFQGESSLSEAQSQAEKVQAIWKQRISEFPSSIKLRLCARKVILEMTLADNSACNAKLHLKRGLEADRKADKIYDELKQRTMVKV